MKEKPRAYTYLADFLIIALSGVIYSVAFNCFFLPNDFSLGGFTGIAQVLNHIFPFIPIGGSVFIMNVPLLIIAWRRQGPGILVATVFAIAFTSLLIDGISAAHSFPPMDPILACLCGSALMGVSVGLMMLKNATTGGSELLARVLKYHIRHLSIGRLCLIVDVAVIIIHAIAFRDFTKALYGIVSMFIISTVMDAVVYGSNNGKLAFIISSAPTSTVKALMELGLGATILSGRGAWSGEGREVILCAFKRNQIANIKSTVKMIDKNAFVIVCEAHEVLGEGFADYSETSL